VPRSAAICNPAPPKFSRYQQPSQGYVLTNPHVFENARSLAMDAWPAWNSSPASRPRRAEDEAYDAAVRGRHRSDPSGGGGSGEPLRDHRDHWSDGHRSPRVVREPTTLIDQPEAWHWVARGRCRWSMKRSWELQRETVIPGQRQGRGTAPAGKTGNARGAPVRARPGCWPRAPRARRGARLGGRGERGAGGARHGAPGAGPGRSPRPGRPGAQ
jgi:hypothetical protein